MFSLLHIDNNFFYKEIIKKLSDEKEFRYFSAKTPTQAYDLLSTHDIDLIITGLEFEIAHREEFIQRLIQNKHESTPIIVFSATEDATLKKRLYELGITKYLTKDKFMGYLADYIQKMQVEDLITTQLKTLKIALLDDNEAHLINVKDIMEKHGVSHVDYYLQSEALLNTSKKYHIYLIDLILPDIPGDEVIAKLRSQDKYAVIIAVSSLRNHNVISHVLSVGADDYITKPLSSDLFMARIKANVRTYSLMKHLKDNNIQLAHLVKVDGLTGFYNHKAIMDILQKEIERAERYNEQLAVIMFDIDRFKLVNDNYGHHIGDEVLKQIGESLKHESRDFDLVGRYGGDEFVVILPETDLKGAVLYAERLRKDIEEMTFIETDLNITISGGISAFAGETTMELMKIADHKLYEAKKNGRNRIVY